MQSLADRLAGCLLGGAIGDALGLPYEGLSPARAAKLLGPPDRYRFLGGWGMVSDDTEHACLTARALAAAGLEPPLFERELGRLLKVWFAALPAGIGAATLKACLRLWLGYPPAKSGVRSAGNGGAMRAAILGLAARELPELRVLAGISTRTTHRDPRAEQGTCLVAFAARFAASTAHPQPAEFYEAVRSWLPDLDQQFESRLAALMCSIAARETTVQFAAKMGWQRGVSGFICDTVAAALHAWFSHPHDIEKALEGVILCGGDTDSTAALTGAIIGSAVGARALPERLTTGIVDWPISGRYLISLAEQLAHALENEGRASGTAAPPFILQFARNLFFLGVVLLHALRRALPPY